MPKVRKKSTTTSPKKNELPKEEVYCRKCMQTKLSADFYQAVDKYLDSNGFMSICRDCIQEMLDRALLVEHSLDKAVLSLCKTLNVKYDERVIESIRNSMDNADKEGKNFNFTFGKYLNLLPRFSPRGEGSKFESRSALDLTFKESDILTKSELSNVGDLDSDMLQYFIDFWGEGFDIDDYEYLEGELAKWQATTKCDTQPELILVKEICYQQNEIRKLRIENKPVAAAVKQLQELMKNSSLTPSAQNAASGGKFNETFGLWIKTIEEMTPAEFYADKTKFKDIDGIEEYAEKYITRPLRNFITDSRDFKVDEIGNIDDVEDDFGDNINDEVF